MLGTHPRDRQRPHPAVKHAAPLLSQALSYGQRKLSSSCGITVGLWGPHKTGKLGSFSSSGLHSNLGPRGQGEDLSDQPLTQSQGDLRLTQQRVFVKSCKHSLRLCNYPKRCGEHMQSQQGKASRLTPNYLLSSLTLVPSGERWGRSGG